MDSMDGERGKAPLADGSGESDRVTGLLRGRLQRLRYQDAHNLTTRQGHATEHTDRR